MTEVNQQAPLDPGEDQEGASVKQGNDRQDHADKPDPETEEQS